jgi:hypothetical protein
MNFEDQFDLKYERQFKEWLALTIEDAIDPEQKICGE